jgi:quaternary ammonium compound-resistance protein SugE
MKASAGFSKTPLAVLTMAAAFASFALLGLAMKSLPVGTAYAVWTGIGAVGAAVLGILLFNEPVTPARIGCIGLIVAGIVGLRLAS